MPEVKDATDVLKSESAGLIEKQSSSLAFHAQLLGDLGCDVRNAVLWTL